MKVRRGRPPRLSLEPPEAELLRTLAGELTGLLEPTPDGEAGDPLTDIVGPLDTGEPDADPVVRRLLPDAYRDDVEAAEEWRRFGRSEVRSAKSEAAQRILDDLSAPGPAAVPLDDDHVPAWLAALTDMRLVLGTRLGISGDSWYDEAARLPDDDPRRVAYAVYDWLTTTQAVILETVG